MKRSEAIETLAINTKLSISDVENFMELAELAVGMAPPMREVRNKDYPEFGMPTKFIHQWEPEDDT
jgi:hypothetical protein